jgi:hypothetical protein
MPYDVYFWTLCPKYKAASSSVAGCMMARLNDGRANDGSWLLELREMGQFIKSKSNQPI